MSDVQRVVRVKGCALPLYVPAGSRAFALAQGAGGSAIEVWVVLLEPCVAEGLNAAARRSGDGRAAQYLRTGHVDALLKTDPGGRAMFTRSNEWGVVVRNTPTGVQHILAGCAPVATIVAYCTTRTMPDDRGRDSHMEHASLVRLPDGRTACVPSGVGLFPNMLGMPGTMVGTRWWRKYMRVQNACARPDAAVPEDVLAARAE